MGVVGKTETAAHRCRSNSQACRTALRTPSRPPAPLEVRHSRILSEIGSAVTTRTTTPSSAIARKGNRITSSLGLTLRGRASAGYGGIIQIEYWDENRSRMKTGYIGEDGLEADVMYRIDDGEFVKAREGLDLEREE